MHKNLYIARKEQRMTQEKAPKLINIAQRTYQSKEQGRHDFTLKKLKTSKILQNNSGRAV